MSSKWALMAVLLCSVFFTAGCSSFFKREPAQVRTDRKHYIMTLHGVRGNEVSFGDFHPLIKAHLEKVDPGYTVVPLNYTYRVAQIDYTPYKAALEINSKLTRDVPVMGPEDKMSVVAYSMGGQVAVAWYYSSLSDSRYAQYPLKTANMISLGAAFWGAQEAGLFTNDVDVMKRTVKGAVIEMNKMSQELVTQYMGSLTAKGLAALQNSINTKKLFPLIDSIKSIAQMKDFYDNKKIRDYYPSTVAKILDFNETLKTLRDSSLRDIAKISFAELEALSVGSPTVSQLRDEMVNRKLDQTRWLSISTLVQCFETDLGSSKPGCDDFQSNFFAQLNKGFSKFTFGHTRRETDNAVITPSSIAQFLYFSDNKADYADNEQVLASQFQTSLNPKNHRVVFAETLHATVITKDMQAKALNYLGKLGKSWERLAEDVVLVYREKCMTPEKCDHPVYKYILDELAQCGRPDSSCDRTEYKNVIGKFKKSDKEEAFIQDRLMSELHGFTLDFNINLPKGYDLKTINESNIFNFIKTDFIENSDRVIRTAADVPYNIQLGRRLELNSILIRKVNGTDQTQMKVTITGLITPKQNQKYNHVELQNGLNLDLSVAFPELKSRRLQVPIKPIHSTYLNLTLAK